MLGNTPDRRTDIRVERSKSFAFTMRFQMERGDPVDLSGDLLRMVIGSPDPLHHRIEPLFGIPAEIADPEQGVARFSLQARDLDLDAASYPYDITLLDGSGYSIPVLKGHLVVGTNSDDDSTNEFSDVDPCSDVLVVMGNACALSVRIRQVEFLKGPKGSEGPSGPPFGIFVQDEEPGPDDIPEYSPIWIDTDAELSEGIHHGMLPGREEPDQHPITSITGLQPELDGRALIGHGHPEYLEPSEIIAGQHISIDTASVPGSVVISGEAGGGGGAASLDELTDVSAPASTPAGRLLGTTAAGTWGPVAPPAPGVTLEEGDARWVNTAGDMMTGPLAVTDLSASYVSSDYGADMGGYRITSVADPQDPQDAATMAYVAAAAAPRALPWTRMITGAQSLPNGTTWRAASAGTVIGPLAGQWSGGVFTFPEPGLWLVTAEVSYRPQGSPTAIDTQFRLTVGGGDRFASGRVPSTPPVWTGISLVSLHTGVVSGTTTLSGAHWHSHNTALEVTSTIIHIVRLSEV